MTQLSIKDANGTTQAVEAPLAPGRAAATLSRPVALSNEDNATIGALTETAPASDTASSGLNGRLQRIAQRLSSLIALLPTALGAGGGLKVDGSGTALPVSASALPLPTGAATAANQSADQVLVGAVTETAPATDTASSGVNGRLQRIAQRLTSLIALLPTALGAGGGIKVDGSGTALPVSLASVPSHAVTNAGTFAVQAATLGGQTPAFGSGATSSATLRVTLASDSAGILSTDKYETVAASQTAQVLGGAGATGDYISGLLVVPATTSPGSIALLDNATSITVFTGGASSVSNLVPFFIPLGMRSVSGAWKVTTGTNVSAIGIGSFT